MDDALGPTDASACRAGHAPRRREEDFLPVLTTGVALVVIGTIGYALGAGWDVVDAVYFAVATLTTTSVADPGLVLQDGWLKVFTILYQLVASGSSSRSFAGWAGHSWRSGPRMWHASTPARRRAKAG
jgi:hypothetical protein